MRQYSRLLIRKFGYTAYTWGNKMTNGWNTKSQCHVQPIESLRNQVKKIEFANKHAALITDEGDLYTWGESINGKLGLPPKNLEKVVPLPTITN